MPTSVTKIGICGAAGRMGRALIHAVVAREDVKLAAAIEHVGNTLIGADAGEMAALPHMELATGWGGDVACVVHRDPYVLRHPSEEGIGLDTELEIVDRVVSGGGMRVLVRGTTRAADRTLDLADPAASAIRVIPV